MSLKDKNFRYRPSFDTDVRRTFSRIRREQAKAAREAATPAQEPAKAARLVLECDIVALVPAPARLLKRSRP